ncbi:hypothetical protein J6590_104277 [Homalodisca vitripennis]|nr:hypothetical protein J6590_104277 [Homalodisca vitripennis]
MPKERYKPEALQAALNDVKNGLLSKKAASTKYGIPCATIQRKEDIQLRAQVFLTQNNRPNPFKERLPGIGWYQDFLRRHPKITQRTAEAVTAASSCVSEMDIKTWFSNIETLMKYRKNHPTEAVTRECVAPLLNEVVEAIKPETLNNGFKACGLYPWKSDAIDFSKCLGKESKKFEGILGDEILDKFVNIDSEVNKNTEHTLFYTLYRVWDEFKRIESENCDQSNVIIDIPVENNANALLSTSHGVLKNENPFSIYRSYATPTKSRENQKWYSTPTQPNKTPLKNPQSSQSRIAEILLWPETPKRKGERETERVPFVITSKK